VDGPADVAVGGVERFQCCAAGEFDPLETELAEFPFFGPSDNAAVAFDTGVAKSVHCCFLLLPFNDKPPYGTNMGRPDWGGPTHFIPEQKNTPRCYLERAYDALSKTVNK
jgi:hypothetical protein